MTRNRASTLHRRLQSMGISRSKWHKIFAATLKCRLLFTIIQNPIYCLNHQVFQMLSGKCTTCLYEYMHICRTLLISGRVDVVALSISCHSRIVIIIYRAAFVSYKSSTAYSNHYGCLLGHLSMLEGLLGTERLHILIFAKKFNI